MAVIVTHGVAMGWHVAGLLALESARSFSGIHCQFLDNSKPGSGCLSLGLSIGAACSWFAAYEQACLSVV